MAGLHDQKPLGSALAWEFRLANRIEATAASRSRARVAESDPSTYEHRDCRHLLHFPFIGDFGFRKTVKGRSRILHMLQTPERVSQGATSRLWALARSRIVTDPSSLSPHVTDNVTDDLEKNLGKTVFVTMSPLKRGVPLPPVLLVS